jgi:diguanylate cyclase (GGDEF)-like protein
MPAVLDVAFAGMTRPAAASQDFAILAEVARLATEDIELRPMLQRITDALASRLGWDLVALVRVDANAGRFVCEALSSSLPTTLHVGYGREIGSGVVGEVAATARAVLIDDARSHPNFVETQTNTLSELCVPIVHRGEVVGILNAESARLAAFSDQLPLAEAIALQISGAISIARLFARLSEASQALEDANRRLFEANRALERLSLLDGLTGLANRRHFDTALDLEWRRLTRSGEPLSLLLVDIDHFKQYNDQLGHPAGDDCLRRVAEALPEVVQRAGDVVARYGGEEFAVVLPGSTAEEALLIAERLRQRIESLALPHPRPGEVVTASVGVGTVIPRSEPDRSRLLQSTDRALYRAKAAGRNRVEVAEG